MTDRTDERRPADDSSDADPFEYPSDAPAEPPERPNEGDGWFRRFRTADSGPLLYARDLVTSVLVVLAIGAALFAVSGVWPPMVAIESGSMEPNMVEGDLVFVVDNDRFVPDGAIEHEGRSTGIVPADVAEPRDRTTFGAPGDVVIFWRNGNSDDTPVIHRAMLWVEGGENWYDRADPDAVGGADDCEELTHCPAPNAGFITKGDNELTNEDYDQVTRLSAPVRPEWIVGTAEFRIPYLGRVRLLFSTATVEPSPMTPIPASATSPEPVLISTDPATDSGYAD